MEFTLKETYPATSEELFNAFLTSEKHSAMTGGEAIVTNAIGDAFSAWDGYITGKNLDLTPFSRILQSWRTSDFTEEEEDSIIEITFIQTSVGTEITLKHTQLPAHGEQYIIGWKEHYFEPMHQYFK